MKQKRQSPRTTLFEQSKSTKNPRYSKSTAVKILEEMATDEAKLLHPNTPERFIARREYKDNSTNELAKCVIDFLRLKGHHCERSGNEGRIIDNRKAVTDILGNVRMIGSVQRVHGSGMRGTSDLKAVIHSKFIAIEIKCEATKDRQSESQKTYQLEVEKAGGIYIIATSFQQFYSWYQSFTDGNN